MLKLVLIVNRNEVVIPVKSILHALKKLQDVSSKVRMAYLDDENTEGIMSFVRLRRSKCWAIRSSYLEAA
jgi:hypothetical protein